MFDTQRRLAVIIVVAMVLGFVLGGLLSRTRSHPLAMQKSAHQHLMGTFAQITALADDPCTGQRAIGAAFEKLHLVDSLMSEYDPNSEISAVNRFASERLVAVSEPVFHVIAESIKWSKLSGGAFDITVGPLVHLWRDAGKAGKMPDSNELAAAKSRVGYQKLILDANNHTIKFAVAGMQIDLGAIAKGYGVDLAVEAMKKAGAKGGLVEVGGDLRAFGAGPDNRVFWKVGIQDPCRTANQAIDEPLYTLNIKNQAVITSGDYYRYASIGPRHISHIIEPNSGLGAQKFSSVTIISDNAARADAIATAVSVMGVEAGLDFVEKNNASAILIGPVPDCSVTLSKNAAKYLSLSSLKKIKEQRKMYTVTKASGKVRLGDWDKGAWQNAKPIDIALFMGDKPSHIPHTQAKMIYDANAVYVAFRVEDNYVRATAEHQGNVCQDSCVEFFFIPSTYTDKGYFNLEMNCGGSMLFHFQMVPRKGSVPIAKDLCDSIEVYHELPANIDPEIAKPTTWMVAYRLPISVLKKYAVVTDPASGVIWQANFYKCADSTSHPHWLTWAKVDRPKPDFHVPENFGQLRFE